MKRLFLPLAAFLLVLQLSAQKGLVPEITAGELQQHISYLASDELAGRYPGTEGAMDAAEYIRNCFRDYGLKLLGDEGFQEFDIVIQLDPGPNNELLVEDNSFKLGQDYVPFPFSQSVSVKTSVVFVGYGFDIKTDSLKWNDYEGVDVYAKWALILRGDPEMDNNESAFVNFGDDRDKVLLARDKGAAGVLLVSGKDFDEKDELVGMTFDKTQSNAGLPVLQVKRTVADQILAGSGKTIEGLEKDISTNRQPGSFAVDTKVYAKAEILQKTVTCRNVAGLLEGSDPELKDSYVVIGGHFDHLGKGGPGSGSRFLDSAAIHNGADDNASGTAGVIELAGKLAANRANVKRSILFICFDGEEQGLLGSKYFIKNPLIDLAKVKAMVNLDMVGRLDTNRRSLAVSGTGTSVEAEDLLNEANNVGLDLGFSPEGYGPSDHASFYAENLPVFFFTTGVHEDYHTPADDWDRINYPGEVDVLSVAYNLVLELADATPMLTFQEAGPKEQKGGKDYRFKVTLGIMPDFTTGDAKGLGVAGVKKDGPADKGGMEKGDVIVAMDGLPVNDIYDYMNRLKKFKQGQRISVDVLRNGEKKVLIIDF